MQRHKFRRDFSHTRVHPSDFLFVVGECRFRSVFQQHFFHDFHTDSRITRVIHNAIQVVYDFHARSDRVNCRREMRVRVGRRRRLTETGREERRNVEVDFIGFICFLNRFELADFLFRVFYGSHVNDSKFRRAHRFVVDQLRTNSAASQLKPTLRVFELTKARFHLII